MLFKKLLLFKNAELSTKQTTQTTTKTTRGPMKATTKKTRKTKQQETREAGDSSDDEEEKQLQEELDLLFPAKECSNAQPPLEAVSCQYEKKTLRAQPKRLSLRQTHTSRRDEVIRTLCAGIQAKLIQRFSQSTWQRRTYLHNTVALFSDTMQLQLCEKTIMMALEWISASVTAGTLLTYATTIRAMYPSCGGENLDSYIQSLRKLSAKNPIRQAPPLTREQFNRLMDVLPENVKWALWLAWKTASRWGETAKLSDKNMFFTAQSDELVVDFKELTKGSATRPLGWT